MMYEKEQAKENKRDLIKDILMGKIFIYPTDTIYGLGCNALNEIAVNKIRLLKQRETKPFSIIVPNLDWIRENCVINEKIENHLKKLPGPYTFFLNLKNKKIFPENVNPTGNGTIGIRIPKRWFSEIISEANRPFITTSVNLSGEPFMVNLEDLNETIRSNVDYIIYEGPIIGRESEKINLTN